MHLSRSLSALENSISIFSCIMESKMFQPVTFLFKVFGFEPLSGRRMTNLWLLFHLVLAFSQFLVVLKYRNAILYTFDMIGKFTDHAKFISTFVSYFMAVFVSWKHKNRLGEISNEVKNLEAMLESLHVNIQSVHERIFLIPNRKFLFFLAVQFLEISLEMTIKNQEAQTMRFLASFTFPLFFCYVKHLHSIFYIDMVNFYISVLNDQLSQLNELIWQNERRLRNPKYNKFLYMKLKICRNIYKILLNLNEMENECMGWLFYVNHINLCIHVLSNIYWITFRIINQEFSVLICKCMLSSVIIFLTPNSGLFRMFPVLSGTTVALLKTLALILISDSGEKAEMLVKLTAYNLHKIIYSRRFKSRCINDLVRDLN